MKSLIKKILKEETLSQTLKEQVKEFGWKKTSELVGDPEVLAKLGFNNNPMEFLNLFNDLEVVKSEEQPDWVLFRYEKENNMMVYVPKDDEVYINYEDIWSFIASGFELKYFEIQELTKEWLGKTYDLKGVTTYGYGSWLLEN